MTPLVSTLRITGHRAGLVVLIGFALMIGQGFIATALGAQKSDAKNLDSASTQIAGSQELKLKDSDSTLSSTAFTYQGQLKDSSDPVNGVFDFQFVLYSAQTGGEPLETNEMKDMALTNGLFSFKLDFGRAVVDTKESWLEIGVRPSGSSDDYTLLFPRQKLTPTPYAIFAQQEQWSLIGVPVGFAGGVEKTAVLTDELADQGVADAKQVSEEPAKSSDSLRDKATDAENKAAAAPNGIEWTRDGAGNLFPTNLGDRVGIGTPTPDTRLNVNSSATNSQAGVVASNSNGDTRLGLWSGFSAGANPPAILYTHDLRFLGAVAGANFATGSGFVEAMRITRNGAVGIGTTAPRAGYTLAVNGATVLTPGGSGGQIFFSTPNAETGMSIQGSNPARADIRFDGSTLKLLAGPGPGSPSTANGIVINSTSSEVTIGDVLRLNNIPGCAAGIGVISPLTCQNYMLVGQPNGNTFINSSGPGSIHFRHNNNEADQMEIRADGTTAVRVLQILGGADISERFDVSAPDTATAETPEYVIDPGMVVSIDPNHPGRLVISTTAYDRRAAGVISGAGGIKPGMLMGQSGSIANGEHPVALTGRVYAWADASNGPIEPGDLLTTSNTLGHAMKVTDHMKAQGAIIGKAMTRLETGRGLVLVLVTLQ